ncbi:MAG: FAD:protein FMN transferase [Oscillospiraceae bacterium]|nr:FAD:protein FMN transferase [Oscillospiraceae bacterium]
MYTGKNIKKENTITRYKALVIFILIITAITIAISGCFEMSEENALGLTQFHLDTHCTIIIHGGGTRAEVTKLLDEAFEIIENFEKIFSITVQDSDVWRINHAGGEPVTVSEHTIMVIRTGIMFGELSDGLFDISIGRLSRLWRFGIDPYIPTLSEIDFAIETVDFRNIVIDGNTVQLKNPDTWIDLGAIAKGYIADQVGDFLREKDIVGAVINLGGDIVTVGTRLDEELWRVAVRDPKAGSDELIGVIDTKEAAIISSGLYERMFVIDNRTYHHILDPRSGMPVITDLVSVTLVADNALVGEALSTTALLVGSEKAIEILEQTEGFRGGILILSDGKIIKVGDIRWLPDEE